MLIAAIQYRFAEMASLLQQLTPERYMQPCDALSGASIGEHTRHIIELFDCLDSHYPSGIVNYDARERDRRLQTDPQAALERLDRLEQQLDRADKPLFLQVATDGDIQHIATNYYRELLFNLDHCVHHQALIRVALPEEEGVTLTSSFGVARATLEYRKQCAP